MHIAPELQYGGVLWEIHLVGAARHTPKCKYSENVVIGAGSLVNKDIPGIQKFWVTS